MSALERSWTSAGPPPASHRPTTTPALASASSASPQPAILRTRALTTPVCRRLRKGVNRTDAAAAPGYRPADGDAPPSELARLVARPRRSPRPRSSRRTCAGSRRSTARSTRSWRSTPSARSPPRARSTPGAAPDGPLRGVPFTVKDNLEAAGLAMAIGEPERAGVVPSADATVVRADARRGRDPARQDQLPALRRRDRDRQPGLRAHEQPLRPRAHAGRQQRRRGGDRRGGRAPRSASAPTRARACACPAHFCGLAAIKPTRGPRAGHRRDRRRGADRRARRPAHAGRRRSRAAWPTSRSLLRVIAGPDGRDGGVAPVPLGDPAAVDLRGLRVAAFGRARPRARRRGDGAACSTARPRRCARRAPTVEEAAPPSGGHDLTIEVWRSYGGELDSLGLYRLLRRWDAYRTEMLAWGERYDLLLSPVFGGPAPPHGDAREPRRRRPDGLHHAAQPHGLAGRDRALRQLARGAADRRPARRRARGATTSRSRPPRRSSGRSAAGGLRA